MDEIEKRYKAALTELEKTIHLLSMSMNPVINPEEGEGKLSEEDRIILEEKQLKACQNNIQELKKIVTETNDSLKQNNS
jgi:hypothetical protein